ncbi:MAG: hypothetical protein RL346_936 [Verrucomicrobiota bacterium]
MRLSCLLAMSLLLVPATTHAAREHKPLIFATTGIQGFALPMWPKVADTVHVTGSEEGSPAFGKLKEGDVIIGIDGVKFSEHPLGAFANALDAAEAADGKMALMMQNGETVTLQLPKLGAYSPTAPYNCQKTDRIIEQTAARLLTEKGLGSTPTRSGLLGLMATGKKEHLDAVAAIIRNSDILKIDPKEVDSYLKTGQPNLGSTGWTWGYNLIALGEYYLLTKDETVLPAIRIYANGLARGQDAVGLWGHRMAIGDKLQRAPGYGIMNAASIPNFVGLLIAQKCGLNDPALDAAIQRTYAYVANHIGNGGFPYGVHGPSYDIFNNNGSSGSAAISMALKGNQEGAKYFSRCCATTHGQLNVGHASHFFNPLWTPLGASLSGPEVTQEFFKRSLWYFNGKRDWRGGFPGDGKGGFIAAQALLTYCLPRKVLLITGREADSSIWVRDKNEVHDLVTMSQMGPKKKTNEELYELFNSPYPQLRVMAEQELGSRLNAIWQFGNKGNKPDPITPRLRELAMQSSDPVRTSALRSIGRSSPYIGRENAAFLASVFNNPQEKFDIRVAAVTALGFGNCRQDALPYYNDILRLCLEERKEPDPFGHVDNKIAQALKGVLTNLNTPELKKDLQMDRALCYRVAKKFLAHPRQQVRSVGAELLQGIPLEDFHIVADDLMHTLENKDPSYHTYSNALDAEGIEILASLNIAEGLDLLEDGIFHGDGKWGFKYGALIKSLPLYGANAKPYIARFERHESVNKNGDRFTPAWQAAVKKINEDQNPKKLMTAKEAKEYGEMKQNTKE